MSVLESIERQLGAALGLRPRAGTRPGLERELARLRAEHGLTADEVDRRLGSEPWLVRRLATALTVEETFFFRHPEQLETLVEHVRRCLAEPGREVVLWSAGCASGEEPYSMAIAIHRALGPSALARVRILANDVDSVSLRKAERATYGRWSFRGTEPWLKATYFEALGKDEHRVVASVRSAVELAHLSLEDRLASLAPGSVDAIFFRNVAIYLLPEALERTYVGFERVLREGGLLILGPADPWPSVAGLSRRRAASGFVHAKGPPEPPERMRSAVAPPGTVRSARETAAASAVAETHHGRAAERPRPVTGVHTRSRRALDVASELADRGRHAEALALVEGERLLEGSTAELLSLRARIHLSQGSIERSIEDLRSALFLEPADLVSRFHYAHALATAHRARPARLQLLDVLRALEGRGDDEAVGPHETAASMRRAANELLRRIG